MQSIQRIGRLLLLLLFPILFLGFFSPSCEAVFMLQPMTNPLGHQLEVNSPWGEPNHGSNNHVHMGIDFDANEGDPVYAVANGVVADASNATSYGGAVVYIQHDSGWQSVYMDMGSVACWTGKPVDKGQVIGYVGGRIVNEAGEVISTGAHLHFEIRTEPNYASSPTLCPYAYAFYAPWLPANCVDPSYLANSKSKWSATFDFTGPVKKVIDKITTACSKAVDLLKGIITQVILILMTIDLSISMLMTTVDSGKSGEPGPPIFKLFISKCFLYLVMLFILTHWTGFFANGIRDFFVDNGAIAGGSNYDTVAKLVANPFDLVTHGAKLISPLFELLDFYGSDSLSITDIPTFFVDLAQLIPAIFFAAIIMGCFILFAIEIAISMLEFYITIVFSFSSFMFAGWKYTRQFAETGVSAIFAVSIKLFFYCFFATILVTTANSIVMDKIVEENADISTWTAHEHADGHFDSVEDLMASILIVETGGREDAYILPSSDGRGYGAWQLSYAYWPDWYIQTFGQSAWDSKVKQFQNEDGSNDNPLAMPFPNWSPAWSSYGKQAVTYGGGDWRKVSGTDGAPGALISPYGANPWSPAEQDAIAKHYIQQLWDAEGGNAEEVCWDYNGRGSQAAHDAYWKKICEANGSMKKKGPKLILGPLILVSVFCIFLVIIGDRIAKDIMRNFGQGGFRFVNS